MRDDSWINRGPAQSFEDRKREHRPVPGVDQKEMRRDVMAGSPFLSASSRVAPAVMMEVTRSSSIWSATLGQVQPWPVAPGS